MTLCETARAMPTPSPPIPYGWSDFALMRRERSLYVDKTRFLRELEDERFAFLIRPRRFGKSCWVSILEHYYDRWRKANFEAVFAGTDIGQAPTANRSRYVILRFDFSAFEDTPETLRDRFETYCHIKLRGALERNKDLIPAQLHQRFLEPPTIDSKLNELFDYAGNQGIPLYVLIDEYDNFANNVLAHRGAEAYHSFTHGSGFYRSFFATLKAGTASGAVERLFVTGVSPITMDDVTSGFNIGANISLDHRFDQLLGFTESEVREILEIYRKDGTYNEDDVLATMKEWYNGYRFSMLAEEDVFNTDMVLYYVKHWVTGQRSPDELIDRNVRIDYGKLRHLLTVNRQLNGNFDLLRHIIGEGYADSEIQSGFPLEHLNQRENFLSLLHYFGLLSIRGEHNGRPRLGIPNQTVRRLMYGYLRDAYRDVELFSVDFHHLAQITYDMAYHGAWEPVMAFLQGAIAEQTGIRDYIQGEKVVQGFLAAYLNITECFAFHTERELAKGYADICLEPVLSRHPGIRHGYVIELKYLKRSDTVDEKRIAEVADKAESQLQGYLADARLAQQFPEVRFTGLAIVFHGWEMVHSSAVHLDAAPESR